MPIVIVKDTRVVWCVTEIRFSLLCLLFGCSLLSAHCADTFAIGQLSCYPCKTASMVYAMAQCLNECLSVFHYLVFCQNGWRDWAGFWHIVFFCLIKLAHLVWEPSDSVAASAVCLSAVCLSRIRSPKLREIHAKFCCPYRKSGTESKNMTSYFALDS